tara:strand:- start:28139 stop:28387 length:249 start_codon:yes stop_codon:yes gene_type:complete
MQCNKKMMIRMGIGIAVMLAIAYIFFPNMRTLVIASAPLLISLICPLAMIFMMKGMSTCDKKQSNAEAEPIASTPSIAHTER